MSEPIKLNLGACQPTTGYVNLDIRKAPGITVFDLNNPIKYKEVSEIKAIHLFEHLKRDTLDEAVRSWYEALSTGGKLILELPDLKECMTRFLAGDHFMLKWIFGNQEHEGQYHHWGWTKPMLVEYLSMIGFKDIRLMPAEKYTELSFRVECIK